MRLLDRLPVNQSTLCFSRCVIRGHLPSLFHAPPVVSPRPFWLPDEETLSPLNASTLSLAKSISMRSDLKTYPLTIAICFVFLAITTTSAQTPPPNTSLTASPVYEKNCAKCHGKTAEGHHFGGPALVSEKTAASSSDDLRNIVANGKGRMPKYASKLSAEEIDTLD